MLNRRAVLAAPLALAATPSLAQPTWRPDRPIRVIIPHAPGGDGGSGLTPNPKPNGRPKIGLLPGFQACRLNRPSPELRRENGLGATETPVVTFSNPQAAAAKPQ